MWDPADVPASLNDVETSREARFHPRFEVLEWRSYLPHERSTAFCRLTILSRLDSDSERGEVEAAAAAYVAGKVCAVQRGHGSLPRTRVNATYVPVTRDRGVTWSWCVSTGTSACVRCVIKKSA